MNVPPYGDTFKRALLQLATLKVKAQDTPNLTVKVSAGGFWYYTSTGASWIEYAGGDSGTIVKPGSPNNKWVLITLNALGNLVILNGVEENSPVFPTLPRGRFPLAAIYITHADTSITEDMIFDIRPVFEIGVTDHRDLQSNSSADCHPAASITFIPGSTGFESTNIQDVILELKTLFDNVIVHAGTSGTSGSSGNTGSSGTSGIDGTSGSSGTSGDIGLTGDAGTSGTSGDTGTSGTSGIDGDNGTSGTSGDTGSSGTSGIDGTSGTSGDVGTSGTSGDSGSSGTSGDTGTSGTSGDIGLTGDAGTSGTSGIDGTSGTSGDIGLTGDAGTSGTSGIDGTSGTSGDIGLTGDAGTSGTSGTSGIDGTSGTSA